MNSTDEDKEDDCNNWAYLYRRNAVRRQLEKWVMDIDIGFLDQESAIYILVICLVFFTFMFTTIYFDPDRKQKRNKK